MGGFVKTGKLNFGDLVSSILADLAKLAVRKSVLGPIADMLSGALGGMGGIFARSCIRAAWSRTQCPAE